MIQNDQTGPRMKKIRVKTLRNALGIALMVGILPSADINAGSPPSRQTPVIVRADQKGIIPVPPCTSPPALGGRICSPNAKDFGYFEGTWRRWDQQRYDQKFPQAIGSTPIPKVPGHSIKPPKDAPERINPYSAPDQNSGDGFSLPELDVPSGNGMDLGRPSSVPSPSVPTPSVSTPSVPTPTTNSPNPISGANNPTDLTFGNPLSTSGASSEEFGGFSGVTVPPGSVPAAPPTLGVPSIPPSAEPAIASPQPVTPGASMDLPGMPAPTGRPIPPQSATEIDLPELPLVQHGHPQTPGETPNLISDQISSQAPEVAQVGYEQAEIQHKMANNAGYVGSQAHSASSSVSLLEMAGTNDVGLDGFCPVTLLETEQWVRGDDSCSVVHKGKVYKMAGKPQVLRFLSDPSRYAPVMKECDPVVFSQSGQMIQGVPDFCVVYDGHLFMFSSAQSLEKFYEKPEAISKISLEN